MSRSVSDLKQLFARSYHGDPHIGHPWDTPPRLFPKPLISLARPTGIEPVFPP
jgi:hypothetical protein